MVFYRKYRPQSLTELIGQDSIKQTLQMAALNGKLAHAYLFCGPRGTGKTSTARILAKIINCEALGGGQQAVAENIPCNKCASCVAITDGSSLDLIEIDAASNRGIDDIRALRENIKLTPSNSHKKVYIIDEVHMLTTEAFNALLKTLEEPPEHAVFILATTESAKIPATILSRVQRLDFQPANPTDLLTALKNVVNSEKIEADEEALQLIAKRADGSFRDSLKLLDQLAGSGEKITLAKVEESLKTGSGADVISLLEALSTKNSTKALEVIHAQIEKGTNLKEFTLGVLQVLRALILVKHGAHAAASESVGKTQFEKLSAYSLMPTAYILSLITSFQTALEKMKIVSIPALPLEVAVIENCLSAQSIESTASVTVTESKISEKTIEKLEQAKQEDEPAVETIDTGELAKLMDKWGYILETIKPYNYSLEALLRHVKVKSCDDGKVILEVPYSFHQRILEAPKSRELLESVMTDVLGKNARMYCVIGQRPIRIEEIANVELAADDEIIRVAAEIFNS